MVPCDGIHAEDDASVESEGTPCHGKALQSGTAAASRWQMTEVRVLRCRVRPGWRRGGGHLQANPTDGAAPQQSPHCPTGYG